MRPHLTLTVPADVFGAAAYAAANDTSAHDTSAHDTSTHDEHGRDGAEDPLAPVAHLEGFGPIGPALVGYLACLGDVTVVTTAGVEPGSGVLNVGRTRRVATLRQRKAVEAHQANRCATPACELPIEEIHHLTWWSAGGTTDLENLIGLCGPCHRLVHQGKLVISVPQPDTAPESESLPEPHPDSPLEQHLHRLLRTPRARSQTRARLRAHERPHAHPGRRYRFTTHRGEPVRRRAGSLLLTDRHLPDREKQPPPYPKRE